MEATGDPTFQLCGFKSIGKQKVMTVSIGERVCKPLLWKHACKSTSLKETGDGPVQQGCCALGTLTCVGYLGRPPVAMMMWSADSRI